MADTNKKFKLDEAITEIETRLTAKGIDAADTTKIKTSLEAFAKDFKADFELAESTLDKIVIPKIESEFKTPKQDLPDPHKDAAPKAALVAAVNLITFGSKKDDIKANLATLEKNMQVGVADADKAKIGTAIKAAAKDVEKEVTIGLDAIKTKVIARLTEAKMDAARITVFETGFDEMVGHLKDDEKKAIAVPENKINAIADAVYALNAKKDDAKTAAEKDNAALGVAGVAATLKLGVTDAKIHDAALKTVKDKFAEKFTDQKDKDASGKLVNEAQKTAEKHAATTVKGVTFAKVASVGLGVGLIAWLVSAFKGKPLMDGDKPVLDDNGQPKHASAPLWKKALLTLLTAATLCFAGKVAVQGKDVGTAGREMLNPLTWVARTAPSPTGAAIGR